MKYGNLSNPKEIKNPDSEQILRDYEAISTARKKGVINRAKVKFSQLTEGMVAFVIGNNDLLIASHAVCEQAILVTNNESEFSRIQNLKLENWV